MTTTAEIAAFIAASTPCMNEDALRRRVAHHWPEATGSELEAAVRAAAPALRKLGADDLAEADALDALRKAVRGGS